MKYIALIMLLLVPSMAHAQTPVPKETANTYFANCIKGGAAAQNMSQQGHEMLCACTAARLTQFFSMEDWTAMTSQDPAVARPAYNKMTINIYAPCMGEPTRERYTARCAKASGAEQQICTCTADKLAFYLQNYGSSLFANILSQNPNVMDPWAALEEDPAYNAFIDKSAQECANGR